jgi:hypothetical protein
MSSKDGNETSAAVDATVLIIGAGELVLSKQLRHPSSSIVIANLYNDRLYWVKPRPRPQKGSLLQPLLASVILANDLKCRYQINCLRKRARQSSTCARLEHGDALVRHISD